MATTIPGKATGIPGMATTIPARHPKVVAFRLESVVAFDRNRWSPSTGMGGRLRPEYALEALLPWLEEQDLNPDWPAHVRATLADLGTRLGHAV
jgi:hypothetical protein